MNVEILLELVDKIKSVEATRKTQNHLKNLSASSQKLAEQPQNQDCQKDFADKFKKFSSSVQLFTQEFDDREQRRMEEIGVLDVLGENIVDNIAKIIQENSVSPAIIKDEIQKVEQNRDTILNHFNSLNQILGEYGFSIPGVPDKEAEMGFQVPREIFQDDFDALLKDLGKIKGIIQIFAEVSKSGSTEIKVRHISTSDPIFILAFDVYTIGIIDAAVTWALDTWRRVEEIRKIRADTKKTGQFSDEEVAKMFDSKIKSMIQEAIEKKAEELKKSKETHSRLEWALRTLLAYVERGLTVEIRLPPAKKSDIQGEEGEESKATDEEIFSSLRRIKSELKFVSAAEEPVLALPEEENHNQRQEK